jgi:hypothetical protein
VPGQHITLSCNEEHHLALSQHIILPCNEEVEHLNLYRRFEPPRLLLRSACTFRVPLTFVLSSYIPYHVLYVHTYNLIAGCSFGQELVLGALPTESASQSTGILPEAAEVLCSQRTQVTTRESHEQKEPFPTVECYEIFPDDKAGVAGLGRGWAAGLLAGVQYVEPPHSPEGLCSHVLIEAR